MRFKRVAVLMILAACTPVIDGSATPSPADEPSATTLAPTTTPPSTTSTTSADAYLAWVLSLETLPGITGYGDFSGVDPVDVNHFLVSELIVKCAIDHDIPAEVTGDGLGVTPSTGRELNREDTEILARCRNGLNVPAALDGPYGGYTLEQAQRVYDHQLWVRDCLAEAGYAQADPPSFDVWLQDRAWDPYLADTEPAIRAGDRPALIRQCPPFPAGRTNG
jgi:hypothetical protein